MMDNENLKESNVRKEILELAKSIVQIERSCFYGDEPERDRLKKIRDEIAKFNKNKS